MERRVAFPEESPRQHALELVGDLPDDSSYEEIQRELAFARMVAGGLADSDAGRTVTHERAGQVIASWAE